MAAEAHIGIGVWSGRFEGIEGEWLRCCDTEDHWLPTGSERQEQADQRAKQADQRAEQERRRAEQLAARLSALGIDPGEKSSLMSAERWMESQHIDFTMVVLAIPSLSGDKRKS